MGRAAAHKILELTVCIGALSAGLLIYKQISEQEMPHLLHCGGRDCQSAVCSLNCTDRCSCSHPTGMLLCVWNYTCTPVLDEYALRQLRINRLPVYTFLYYINM